MIYFMIYVVLFFVVVYWYKNSNKMKIDEMNNIVSDRENVKTKNGYSISAKLLNRYPKGKLFFAQDRVVITDFDNNEIANLDLIDLIQDLR